MSDETTVDPSDGARRFEDDMLLPSKIRNLPPPRWLVQNVLPVGSTAILYAPQGSFKSFLAQDLAWHIATGKPWLGKHQVRRGRVLYVAGEGAFGTAQRMRAWESYHGIRLEDDGSFVLRRAAVNLHSPDETMERLLRWAAEVRPTFVVLDTLRRMSGGGDENETKSMGLVIDNVELLRRTAGNESSVLTAHHSNARGDKWRGNTVIGNDADVVMRQERVSGKLAATLHSVKQKDADDFPSIPLSLVPVEGSLVVMPGAGEPPPLHERILLFLAKSPDKWFSGNKIREGIGATNGKVVGAALEALYEAELVEQRPGPRNATEWRVGV